MNSKEIIHLLISPLLPTLFRCALCMILLFFLQKDDDVLMFVFGYLSEYNWKTDCFIMILSPSAVSIWVCPFFTIFWRVSKIPLWAIRRRRRTQWFFLIFLWRLKYKFQTKKNKTKQDLPLLSPQNILCD